MGSNHSFDITSTVDMQELDNATNQTLKEVANRYDLKDSNTTLEIKEKEKQMILESDDEYKVNAVFEILKQKVKSLSYCITSTIYIINNIKYY